MSKTALITGASGGIGHELAKIFAREGYNLVLVARSENKLIDLQKKLEKQYRVSVEIIVKDLSVKDAPADIYRTLSEANKHIDVLVNNAGFGDYGEFAEVDWNKQYSMVQLNIVALMHMTKLFLQPMREAGEGKILNMASTAAFQPGPYMSVYYATKAFVLSFSEALSKELQDSGVTVTAFCPGPTQTGFEDAASLGKSKLFKIFTLARAEDVANYGYRELMRGQPVAIHGFFNKLLAFSLRFAPRSVVRKLMYKIQSKDGV